MKKRPDGRGFDGRRGVAPESEHLSVGVAQAGELGLMQAPGLQDPLPDEGEVVHNVPLQRQPRSLLPRHASHRGMNVVKP